MRIILRSFLLLLTCLPTGVISQTQLGSSINGTDIQENFGASIAISSEGNIVAIGASSKSVSGPGGSFRGQVCAYQYIDNQWVQMGMPIYGLQQDDHCGWSVALSGDGLRLALTSQPFPPNTSIGTVRIYNFDGNNWIQMGPTLSGSVSGDRFGSCVSFSEDGSLLAIGISNSSEFAPSAGAVKIYSYLTTTWSQVGNTILGATAGDRFGEDLDLSADGSTVGIVARFSDVSGESSGQARVFGFNGSSWQQKGGNINGSAEYDFLKAVSVSGDGSRVAIGIPEDDDNGFNAGRAQVFDLVGSEWVQLGEPILGAYNDALGWSLALSSDGSKLAVGATTNDGGGVDSGECRIFGLSGNNWVQLGNSINGSAGQRVGLATAMSADASTLIVGATNIPNNSNYIGQAGVFDISMLLNQESFTKIQSIMTPNPTEGLFTIKLDDTITFEKANLYNSLGQFIQSYTTKTIDLTNFTTGLYIVEVYTNAGIVVKKMLLQ